MTDYSNITRYSKRTENKSALSRAYLHPLWDRNILKEIGKFKINYLEQGRYREAILQALENKHYTEAKKIMELTGDPLDPNLELQAAGYRGDLKEINRLIETTPKNKLIISRVLLGAAKANNVDILREFSQQNVNLRLALEEALKNGSYDAAVYLDSIGAYSPKIYLFIGYSGNPDLKAIFDEKGIIDEKTKKSDYYNGVLWKGDTKSIIETHNELYNKNIDNIRELTYIDLYHVGRAGNLYTRENLYSYDYFLGLAREGHWNLFHKYYPINRWGNDGAGIVFEEAARSNQAEFIRKFSESIKTHNSELIIKRNPLLPKPEEVVIDYTIPYIVAEAMDNIDAIRILQELPHESPINAINIYVTAAATIDNPLVFEKKYFLDDWEESPEEGYCIYLSDNLLKTVIEYDAVEMYMRILTDCKDFENMVTNKLVKYAQETKAASILKFLSRSGLIFMDNDGVYKVNT